MNKQQKNQLTELGYVYSEQHQAWINEEKAMCIRETKTEDVFQCGRIEEGIPVWQDETYDFQAAVAYLGTEKENLSEEELERRDQTHSAREGVTAEGSRPENQRN